MKNLKFLLFIVFSILCVGFTACGDEKEDLGGVEEEVVDKDSLIGTWQCVGAVGYEKYTYNPEYSTEWDKVPELTVTLQEDGTIVANENSGKWKLKGYQLTTTFVYREILVVDERTFTILELSGSELIIERSKKGVDYDYYDKLTFKKIDLRDSI